MIRKKPAPHLMRGGYRFSEKIVLKQKMERDDDSKKSHRARAAPIHDFGKDLQNESERAMTRNVDIADPNEPIQQAAMSGCALLPDAKGLLKFRSRS